MGYTKRQFVNAAFSELGLGSYDFSLPPEAYEFGLAKLDAMMANWAQGGVQVGFPIVINPEDSSLDTECNINYAAYEAIVCNLAIKVSPFFGKQVMPQTTATANMAYNNLATSVLKPIPVQLKPTTPLGAGNKPWVTTMQNFVPNPTIPLVSAGDIII